MKKLMTSLLAVLLCGLSLCWAQTYSVMVSVGCTDATATEWTSGTVTFSGSGDLTRTNSTNYRDGMPATVTVPNIPSGTYTLSFEGVANGKSYLYKQENVSVTENLVGDKKMSITATLDPNVSLFIRATYTPSSGGTAQYLQGATISCKEKDNASATPITDVTSFQQGYNQAIIKVDPSKSYTITATATGYTEGTAEWEANSSNPVVSVAMEPVIVTVSGTLTLGEETVSALPEGLSLAIKSNGTTATATVSETGYTVKCQPGSANIYVVDENASYDYYSGVNLAKGYTVMTPANGSFTITDNESHTFTQNIVIKKTGSKVTVQANPDDKLGPRELKLITTDNRNVYPSVNQGDPNTFIFNDIPAGTHTLELDHFGLKIKEGTAFVTVADNLEDVTKTLETEAAPIIVKVSGVAQYRDKTITTNDNRGELVNLSEGTVKLYPAIDRKPDVNKEAVGTGTIADDGTFSFSANITETGYYAATLTSDATRISNSESIHIHDATDQTLDFTGNINVIWISGEVTNHADLSNVELEWTWKGEIIEGYDPNSSVAYEYDPTTGKYYAYVPGAAPMPGTCTLNLRATNSEGLFMVANEDVTIDTDKKAVTKNLTATQDPNSGYMTVHFRYHTDLKDIAVAGIYVYAYLNDGTESGQTLGYSQTDNNGDLKILVDKDHTYKLVFYKERGYADMTANSINGFKTVNDISRPNDTTIFLEAAPIPAWVKLTGSVTLPEGVTKLSDLGDDLQIAVQTARDLKVMTSAIKDGNTYTIDSIPIITKSVDFSQPLFLAQTGGNMSSYGVEVPYNYVLEPDNVAFYTYEDYSTKTQNVSIKKIACNVSGSVSPAKTGEATLTKQGDEEPTYKANIVGAGTYTFRGVLAGTYTLTVNCAGYALATREVTVETTLADVTVDAITLESAPLTVEVGGNLTFTRNDKIYYFEGAELAIYDGDKKLAASTVPEGSMGTFSFTFTSTIGTTVRFTMKHPSIKDVSKDYKVTSDKLTINASDLNYEFIESGNDDYVVMTDIKAEWNKPNYDGLNLSWTWPEGADGKIKKITLSRKLSVETGNGVELTTWEATGDNPHDNTFAADELPVAYADTVTVSTSYAYLFEILYADLHRESVWFTADMRDGDRYKLTYTVNDDKMGTISSYMQPEGEYQENDPITVTATAKPGYKFVEFLKNDQKLTEAELGRITLLGSDRDSVAIFGFNMPAEDLTVKAVFAAKDPDATVEYTVTLVSSNEAWGTVSGGGKFKEGTEIEVKATVTDAAKYKFVAWKEGDKEVSKDATYKFKVEKDITLTAVFEEPTANENLKATRWAIFAEDGAIVIKGINGDRYDIYDLNGRLSGSALCTGAEIRLGVAKSKLYIVRRLGADGSFDAKKIVVR